MICVIANERLIADETMNCPSQYRIFYIEECTRKIHVNSRGGAVYTPPKATGAVANRKVAVLPRETVALHPRRGQSKSLTHARKRFEMTLLNMHSKYLFKPRQKNLTGLSVWHYYHGAAFSMRSHLIAPLTVLTFLECSCTARRIAENSHLVDRIYPLVVE